MRFEIKISQQIEDRKARRLTYEIVDFAVQVNSSVDFKETRKQLSRTCQRTEGIIGNKVDSLTRH